MQRVPPIACLPALLILAAGWSAAQEWKPLFNGKSLEGWRATPFARSGEVRVEKGYIYLGPGNPMTGVNWTGSFPKSDYELRYEAARLKGGDFFASLTLPVGESYGTFVTGGWGGDIVGFSSIDGWDASDNETRSYFTFEPERWYAFRVRLAAGRITAWIDNEQIFSVDVSGRAIGLRHGDIKLSAPFGFASYNTAGGIRRIEYRLLPAGAKEPTR